jgi:hypothetical protein
MITDNPLTAVVIYCCTPVTNLSFVFVCVSVCLLDGSSSFLPLRVPAVKCVK